MVVYIVLKEAGEWKLVQSGRSAANYVHTTSEDKRDVISFGNQIMSHHAEDEDEFAVLVVKKATSGIQAARSRNSDMGRTQVQAFRQDHNPYRRFVELMIEHPNTQTEEAIVGYYVTRRAAEKAAFQVRKGI